MVEGAQEQSWRSSEGNNDIIGIIWKSVLSGLGFTQINEVSRCSEANLIEIMKYIEFALKIENVLKVKYV